MELDAGWKKTRRVKSEVRFLNRPLSLDDEPDVRRFFLTDAQGRVMALLFFDPLYRDGQVIGYATAFKRRDASLTNGYAEPGIMKTAISKFQAEGRTILRLGLSPLAQIENKNYRHHWMLHRSFRYGFNSWWVNRYFYNLQGHAAFKQRFGGVEEQTYFATPSLCNDVRIAAMLRYSRLI
jgi:phosphatidylglycerol lysyltransferase